MDKPNNMFKNEIVRLKHSASDLRELLVDCHNVINDETREIHKEFLEKIEVISEAKKSLENELHFLEKRNECLEFDLKDLNQEQVKLEQDVQELKQCISANQIIIAKLESKIELLTISNSSLESKEKKIIDENQMLKNELASLKYELKSEQESKLKYSVKVKETEHQNESLQILVQDFKANETCLQDHVCEVEAICSNLREQMDKQHKYFVQKEISAKSEFKRQNKTLKAELTRLQNETKNMKNENDDLASTLKERRVQLDSSKCVLEREETKSEKLKSEIKSHQNMLLLERETIEMLKSKNTKLHKESHALKQQLKKVKNMKPQISQDDKESNKSKEIEKTLQSYFDDKLKNIERSYTADIELKSSQIIDLKSLLSEEHKQKTSLQLELENIKVEFEKCKKKFYTQSMGQSNSSHVYDENYNTINRSNQN